MIKGDDKSSIGIYSNYIIGIVALVLSLTFNPLPGLILGIIGLVRVGKQKDVVSKKAKMLNIVAVIVGVVFLIVSVIFTIIDFNLNGVAY
jgi:hypothetical protein